MSETLTTIQPVDQLPILPESHPLDPLAQCGVLYLGTAPISAGLRALDSIQQPFSHRYPVDGTNTVRGIDAVLSVYDNGVQLVFTRQPHVVIFFPISSLIYCASLRFSIIENDPTKPSSLVDWRFMPLDTITNEDNKHPPLFCAVIQRTQVLPGEECHCFITKSTEAAIALVRTITEVYANLRSKIKCLKSPIFYQLDNYGRKLSETTGVIYISPANDDDSQFNRSHANRLTDDTITRHYLFDPSYDGYFYRTDVSLIEQWQLWDDDLSHSRPRPPASPFGLHEGLYHDDTTDEIQRYLRQMDDENQSCSCSSSISSSKNSSTTTTTRTTSSVSTEYSRKQKQSRSNNKLKATDDTDQFNRSFSNLQTSSFEPVQRLQKKKKIKKRPIIIEKVVPNPALSSIPILNPKLPQSTVNLPNSIQEAHIDCHQPTDSASISYQINERGEKITKEGNRIVFMDVVQMNTNQKSIDSQSYKSSTSRHRSHRHRTSKHIPIIDMQSIERLFNEKNSKNRRQSSLTTDNQSKEQSHPTHYLTTPNQFEIIDRYFEDYHGNQIKSNDSTIPSIFEHIESTDRQKPHSPRKMNITSSTHSSKNETRHHRSHPAITTGPSINYFERPYIPSSTSTRITSPLQQSSPKLSILTDEKLNEYVSNIYGTARSMKSSSSSTTHPESKSFDNTGVVNATYMSGFRYMQSSMNRNILEEYRNAY